MVLFPLETKSAITMGRTKLLMLALWLLSLLLTIPALFSKVNGQTASHQARGLSGFVRRILPSPTVLSHGREGPSERKGILLCASHGPSQCPPTAVT